MPFVNVTFLDKEGNSASFGYGLLDAANEAASHALINALALGTTKQRTIIANRIPGSDTLPSSPFAQAGLKLRIHWTDDVTGESGFYSLPTANLADLNIVGDQVDMTQPVDITNLVTDINTNWSSPKNNAITVQRMEVVTVNR